MILKGFYQPHPTYRLAQDLSVDIKVVTRVCQRVREALYHMAELEDRILKEEVELDQAYFGGKRGHTATGKRVRLRTPRAGKPRLHLSCY